MSKLSEMIKAAQTSERRAVIEPLIDFRTTVERAGPASYPEHYVYNFKAEFGCSATVKYGAKGDLDQKVRMIRRQVVEYIFGEFREDIHAIERALFDYDTQAAEKLVGDLYRKMFDV